jgi:L-amino acid N-acyltransferase YncA
MHIRKAEIDDLEALLAIYNYEIEHGVATFDLYPATLAERRIWFDEHNVGNHPLLVAECDGHIAGYASLSAFREKTAYDSTVELSVYVNTGDRRRGVATALMHAILELARRDPRTHVVVSVITSGNDVSVKLHETFGFTYCGTIHEAGFKMGSYRDVLYYELAV